jgi:hypothetical protein
MIEARKALVFRPAIGLVERLSQEALDKDAPSAWDKKAQI